MTDWKETTLWKHLKDASGAEAEAARALLVQEMPRIQTILTQAHTGSTDFTLHDADHSFRVARWMAEIIPGDVLEKLSPYEITLLLFAAYLHDIGMTPEQGRVDRFWSHLVYGAPGPKGPRQPLTEEEARDLQGWLDDEGREITVPLAPDGAASEETKRLADLLIAHYCRHKHNDWSGEWIRANLRREALPSYETWVDDLVQLCRSHHEGYEELRQGRFDPRPAGPSGRPVHHRYLACVLRVADVLEIDPERTPEVIFRHREIHPGSVLFWRKDHENWIIRDGNSLVLTAYPESAVLENAIRRTAEGIQQELSICFHLDREEPFSRWKLFRTKKLPHRWDFPEVLTVHVQPRNDAYVYIDGAFRPNTEKLLELLSGTQLYGDPIVAVRELLQNSFDAVKEEMAYQRLERPSDPELAKSLAHWHRVELRLEERDGRRWLVCKDTGVGMTRRIIEDYLLVSGNSRRREIFELERRCQEAGFRLGRTGRFGIGVLSYFMLADRVEIRTRRSPARADAEAIGWSFATEGVGSFGELKKEPPVASGTEVRLRLREELKWEQPFERELEKYLKNAIRYVPCSLELHGVSQTKETISWKAGWIHSLEEPVERILHRQWLQPKHLFPASQREKAQAEQRFIADLQEAVKQALHWKEEEGELPNNLGIYRILVPWFQLPGGRSEAFMLIRDKEKRRVVVPLAKDTIGILPRFGLIESFHGMALESSEDFEDEGVGFREINWESPEAGRLSVDRSSLQASPLAADAVQWLETRTSELLVETLIERPSEYTSLNSIRLSGPGANPYWAQREANELVWGPLSFPLGLVEDFGRSKKPVCFRGHRVAVLFPLQFETGWVSSEDLLPSFFQTAPDRLVAGSQRSSFLGVVRLWESAPNPKSDRQCPLGMVSQFPPAWRKVCGVSLGGSTVWNVDHSMVSRVDEGSVTWFEGKQKNFDLVALDEEILASSGRATRVLAWVMTTDKAEDTWSTLLERDPSRAERLLHAALGSNDAGEEGRRVGFLKRRYDGWKLIVLTPESVTPANPGNPLFKEFLPPPEPDWTITEADSGDAPA